MLALLHTSPVHVPTFDRLRDVEAPGLELRHVVAEDLLARARQDGPESVTGAVEQAVRDAFAAGAAAILCTCSTIGGIAETAGSRLGRPVLRVDRPMATAAVATGPRIAVLAALASTITPTVELIREEATAAGRPVEVSSTVIAGAWDRFEAGDLAGYLDLVAGAVSTVGQVSTVDVIVLAQASMAPAADRASTAVPVLSSPGPGFRAATALAGWTRPSTVDPRRAA